MRRWSIGSDLGSGLLFSPDGAWLLTVGEDLELWDTAGERVKVLPRPRTRPRVHYTRPAFSPDGRYLASLCWLDRRLLIWYLRENFASDSIPFDDSYRFWSHFTPDGHTLLAGCYTTRRYEVGTWNRLPSIRTPIVPRRFSADRHGNYLITEGHAQFFCVSLKDMRPRGQWYHGSMSEDTAQGLALSPDGSLLAQVNQGGWQLWEVPSGRRLRVETCDEPIRALDFSPDGRILALACDEGIRFLESESWAEKERYRWRVGQPVGLAFPPDGLRCAVLGRDGRLVLWDVE